MTCYWNVIPVIERVTKLQAAVKLMRGDEMIVTVWAESIPFWSTATGSAVLSLEKGQQAWLTLLSRASHLHGYMYSTFSGYLLFENWFSLACSRIDLKYCSKTDLTLAGVLLILLFVNWFNFGCYSYNKWIGHRSHWLTRTPITKTFAFTLLF